MQASELALHDNRAYHLGITADQIASNIFLVGDPARAYILASLFDTIDHEICNREYVTLTGSFQGIAMSVIGTGIGTDNVEIAIIEAYYMLCFDLEQRVLKSKFPPINIIRIGTSGGIQSHIPVGTMAIAQYGLGLDSTGLFYDHPTADPMVTKIEASALEVLEKYTPVNARFKGKIHPYASKATPSIIKALEQNTKAYGDPSCSGITISVPGFYGPSGRTIQGLVNTIPDIKFKLAEIQVDGLQTVNMEMESSIIFHLCSYLGIRCGTICPIISHPQPSTAMADYQLLVKRALNIGLAAMAAVAKSNQ